MLRYVEHIQQLDLSQVKLIVFLTCEGGLGGYNQENVDNGSPTNIVEACVASGAETVIAFSEITRTDMCNDWITSFFGIMDEGGTVTEAIEDISTRQDEYQILSDIAVVGGNTELTLSDIFS